jgi:tetratricopeptide (TPR) repeat protein
MKKILSILTTCLLLASCAEFTELQPKGKNLLSTTDELELLLNAEFEISGRDMQRMCGDNLSYSNINNLLSSPNPSRYSIMITWDESKLEKFAELTASDNDYSELTNYVGRIANPILSRADEATGEETKKKQLKAEAYTLRAYSELLLVSKFAAAYNPSTAANTPGVPYLMEDWDISVPAEQWTIAQVYDQIIADCDAAIALNALPVNNINKMRMSKACPHAVKSLALMAMQKYDEAEAAAKEVLAINSSITDYLDAEHTTIVFGNNLGGQYPAILLPKLKSEEDLFHTYDLVFFEITPPEALARFEEGYATKTRFSSADMMLDYMMDYAEMMSGYPGMMAYDLESSWNSYGLKTTHQYLIIAECEIRKGNIDEAMRYLDAIRVKRVESEFYAPLQGSVSSKADALVHLKQVSHGENIYSVWNFINRKRWNQLDDMKETFTRTFDKTYTLTPESKMWIFPFPKNAINNNPNLKQNCL